MSEGFILHGTIVYSRDPEHLEECPDSYVICRDGYSEGVYSQIPDKYKDLPVEDYWDKLIIPGMMDLFTCAPAFQVRGMYLNRNEGIRRSQEAAAVITSFSDDITAERAYDMLVDSLYIGATTRAVILGDDRTSSTLRLMDLMDESGLISCVGMSPVNLPANKKNGDNANIDQLVSWLNECAERFERTNPILFLSEEKKLSKEERLELLSILKETGLPTFGLANFISFGPDSEKKDNPKSERNCLETDFLGNYGSSAVYQFCNAPDVEGLLRKNGIYSVSCPITECCHPDLPGQILSAKSCLRGGINTGFGSGLAECGTNMMRIVQNAIFSSGFQSEKSEDSLTFEEAFYIATAGGGKFFGNCGTFERGSQFDAVVLDDQICDTMVQLSPRERLERMIYLSDDRNVVGKYVFGDKLY